MARPVGSNGKNKQMTITSSNLRGMQNKPWCLSIHSKRKIIERYKRGLPVQNILARSGISTRTLYYILRSYKVRTRNKVVTKQLAERMKVAKHTIGSRLSKAANYGTIDRTLYRK